MLADEQAIAVARAALGEDSFARNWEQGRHLPLAQLVREALGVPA
jgi:hypothetical protein